MVSRLDIKHMRVFLQLVREKNASKVAEEMGLSQQAVSAYIKRLRSEFPQELFVRQSVGLQPTNFAYELAEKFERVVQDFERIFDTVGFEPDKANRIVRVIANEYAQLTLIPMLAFSAREKAPGLRFSIIDFDARTYSDLLASGAADLVIAFAEHVDGDLPQRLIREERYSCVVGRGSKLVSHIKGPADLSRCPHVTFANDRSQLGGSVDDFLASKNVTRNVVSELSCYTSLHAFISCNDVIAFVPSAIARTGDFITLDVGLSAVSFGVVVAWHRRTAGTPMQEWLVRIIDEIACAPQGSGASS